MLAFLAPVLSFFGGLSPATFKILAVGLAILSAVVFIDRRATYRERAKCEVAKVESQLAAARADADNARKAAALEEGQRVELEALSKTQETELEKLRAEIAKRPLADQCRFGTRAPKR